MPFLLSLLPTVPIQQLPTQTVSYTSTDPSLTTFLKVKAMPTTHIKAWAIAQLLHQQPQPIFDCKELNVQISLPHGQGSYKVDQLQLCVVPTAAATAPMEKAILLQVELAGTFTKSRESLKFISISATNHLQYSFLIEHEFHQAHPVLQAIPTTAVPFSTSHLQSSTQIPLEPPYCCTLDETHQLLRTHIHDLPYATIQTWTVPLVVSHIPAWPNPITHFIPQLKYSNNFRVCASFSIAIEEHPQTPTISLPANEPHALYALRDRIIFRAIFSLLQSQCAWARYTPSRPVVPFSFLTGNLRPDGLPPSELVAFPSLPADAPAADYPPTSEGTFDTEPLLISTYFASTTQNTTLTPEQILHAISTAIANAKYRAKEQAEFLTLLC